MNALIELVGVAFLTSFLLTPRIRDVFGRLGVVDLPNDRKIHSNCIPRVGGVAILVAYLVASIGLGPTGHNPSTFWMDGHLLDILPGAAIVFLVGLVDDLFGLSPAKKLIGQIAGALVAYGSGIQVTRFLDYPLPQWWSLPVTVLWLLAYTNAVNLIDGVDGLAAGLCLFASTTTVVAGILLGNLGLALVAAPLIGALLGFLRFNFSPATVFLGDSGTLLTGFLLGCFGVIWSQDSTTLLGMLAPLMALAVPLLDTGFSIVRRLRDRRPLFGADRGHIHHRLLDQGLTQRDVAIRLYAFCALGAVYSLCMTTGNVPGILFIALCAITWALIQRLSDQLVVRDRSFRQPRSLPESLPQAALRQPDLAASTPRAPQNC